MKTPDISIIVPVYNVSQYLPKCLDSLVNQTFRNIEIICFNDASNDNSLEILNTYAARDPRIIIIDSEVNIKQGGGRNRGIRASKAEYIMFVDPDDWVDTSYVEKLYSAITINDADIASADYYIWNNGKTNEITQLGVNIQDDIVWIKRQILLDGCAVWSSIYKKSLFVNNNLFFPEGIFYEDNAIVPALFLAASKIVKIDEFLYYYRLNNNSTTNSINNYNFFDRLHTSILAIDNIKRLPNYDKLSKDYIKEINWMFTKLYLVNTMLNIVTKFSPIPIDRIRPIFENMNNYFPGWRNQVYYKNIVSSKKRMFIFLLERYPRSVCAIYGFYHSKIKKKIKESLLYKSYFRGLFFVKHT